MAKLEHFTLKINRIQRELAAWNRANTPITHPAAGLPTNCEKLLPTSDPGFQFCWAALKNSLPKSFEVIDMISLEGDEPCGVCFTCIVEGSYSLFVVDEDNECYTPLGDRVIVGGNLLFSVSQATGLASFEWMLKETGTYWNPEWPMPDNIHLRFNNGSIRLDVELITGVDNALLHILLHPNPDQIWDGMLPVIEDFVNRRLQNLHDECTVG